MLKRALSGARFFYAAGVSARTQAPGARLALDGSFASRVKSAVRRFPAN